MNDKNKIQNNDDMNETNNSDLQGNKGGISEVTSNDLDNAAETLDFDKNDTDDVTDTIDEDDTI